MTCCDPRELATYYPRGGKALIGPFNSWNSTDTRTWFAKHNVPLKVEADGRIFPVSNTSQSVIDCLINTARELGVVIQTGSNVIGITPHQTGTGFNLDFSDSDKQVTACAKVLIATGGHPGATEWQSNNLRDSAKTGIDSKPRTPSAVNGYMLAKALGHKIEEPVPSLFTLQITDPMLDNLAGVSIPQASLKLSGFGTKKDDICEKGPILVTHRGISGPAVLRLSAWGARKLFSANYKARLVIHWCPDQNREQIDMQLRTRTEKHGKQQIGPHPMFGLPRRLWLALVLKAGIKPDLKWASLSKKGRLQLVETICATTLEVIGRNAFKDEFVTCGGVCLSEINTRSMESKICPGLFLAGEVLNIDGVTGGFNFQAAWTTGYLAGSAMGNSNI